MSLRARVTWCPLRGLRRRNGGVPAGGMPPTGRALEGHVLRRDDDRIARAAGWALILVGAVWAAVVWGGGLR